MDGTSSACIWNSAQSTLRVSVFLDPTFRNIAQLAKVKIMKRPGGQWKELMIPRR